MVTNRATAGARSRAIGWCSRLQILTSRDIPDVVSAAMTSSGPFFMALDNVGGRPNQLAIPRRKRHLLQAAAERRWHRGQSRAAA